MSHSDLSCYNLDLQVLVESSDAILLSYLKDQAQAANSQEMLLSALRAYYLPFAYEALRAQGFAISDQELAQIAQDSIHLLLDQIDQITQQFCGESVKMVLQALDPEVKTGFTESPDLDLN